MLGQGVQYLKGIGPRKAEVLKSEAGIETIEDLLYYIPRRYLDRSSFKPIRDCFVGEVVTIAGTIQKISPAGKFRKFLEVVVDDGTDTISAVFFGGFRYFEKAFSPGDFVLLSGKIDFYRKKQIVHPDFDFLDEESTIKSINTGRVVPLYPSTEKLKGLGLDSRGFRKIIRIAIDQCLRDVEEPLEQSMLDRLGLIPIREALTSIHFPETIAGAEEARKRLSFNELYMMQYYLSLTRRRIREGVRNARKTSDESLYVEFVSSLPFTLTADQERSIGEISEALDLPYPMNRLLQGDVGSGKTVVAMAASLRVVGRGEQVAVMAPTEILSRQHFENFRTLLPSRIRVVLLTGSLPKGDKMSIHKGIAEGGADIVIGTHAVIQDEVTFRDLGLIVIDEQHRFGVNQRAKLREKGNSTDLLIMTATPIPRSLSLTLYGDLDVSLLREKPAGRSPVRTMSFPESKLKGVYKSVEKYVSEGGQAYFVLPLIEESEKMDLKSAIDEFNHLKGSFFSHRKIEILHGRLPSAEKESIMQRFKNGEIDILVSTTVIEVGVDVANANIMVIEHAERFGLSQLHQLRGRVGRGKRQSFCVLVHPDDISDDSKKRIATIVGLDDGFRIAEEDLKIRGSGEIIGTRQHGYASGLEFADLARDLELILSARREAEARVSAVSHAGEVLDGIRNGRLSTALKGIRTKRILSILS